MVNISIGSNSLRNETKFMWLIGLKTEIATVKLMNKKFLLTNTNRPNSFNTNFPFCKAIILVLPKVSRRKCAVPIIWPHNDSFWVSARKNKKYDKHKIYYHLFNFNLLEIPDTQLGWKYRTASTGSSDSSWQHSVS